MKQYQTIQGDMWDSIAKKVYGTEKAMELLMQANPTYLDTAAQEQENTMVPPWRR